MGRMRQVWEGLGDLIAWISKCTGPIQRKKQIAMSDIEKRVGKMPSTLQMTNGKVAQGFLQCPKQVCLKMLQVALDDTYKEGQITAKFPSKGRQALALKIIANYPTPDQLHSFPKNARALLEAVSDATGEIADNYDSSWESVRPFACSLMKKIRRLPERDVWMLWLNMVQAECNLTHAELANAWQDFAFHHPPLPEEWQSGLKFTGANQNEDGGAYQREDGEWWDDEWGEEDEDYVPENDDQWHDAHSTASGYGAASDHGMQGQKQGKYGKQDTMNKGKGAFGYHTAFTKGKPNYGKKDYYGTKNFYGKDDYKGKKQYDSQCRSSVPFGGIPWNSTPLSSGASSPTSCAASSCAGATWDYGWEDYEKYSDAFSNAPWGGEAPYEQWFNQYDATKGQKEYNGTPGGGGFTKSHPQPGDKYGKRGSAKGGIYDEKGYYNTKNKGDWQRGSASYGAADSPNMGRATSYAQPYGEASSPSSGGGSGGGFNPNMGSPPNYGAGWRPEKSELFPSLNPHEKLVRGRKKNEVKTGGEGQKINKKTDPAMGIYGGVFVDKGAGQKNKMMMHAAMGGKPAAMTKEQKLRAAERASLEEFANRMKSMEQSQFKQVMVDQISMQGGGVDFDAMSMPGGHVPFAGLGGVQEDGGYGGGEYGGVFAGSQAEEQEGSQVSIEASPNNLNHLDQEYVDNGEPDNNPHGSTYPHDPNYDENDNFIGAGTELNYNRRELGLGEPGDESFGRSGLAEMLAAKGKGK
eukprot:g1914.t1